MRKMNNKGVVFMSIVIIALILLGIYLLLFLPIPKFATIRSLINYIMIVIVWFLLQVGLIYGYYRLSILANKGLQIYKKRIQIWTFKVKNYLISQK